MPKIKNRVFHIYETKQVVYTHMIYAKTKKEALEKYHSNEQNKIEIGLDSGNGITKISVANLGVAFEKCSSCNEKFSPANISDYLCLKCENNKELTHNVSSQK